jgi:hypothetical protein
VRNVGGAESEGIRVHPVAVYAIDRAIFQHDVDPVRARNRASITDYIKRHPKLQELDEEIRTARLDMCEDVVDMHVERCDLRAAMFQLRLLGKHRGYSD